MDPNGGFRRALVLMTASSLLVPLIGLATAPILAQALGPDGRGAAAAALAPNLLVVSVATIGLPEALTYHLAKRPHNSRVALLLSSGISAVLGALCLVATFFAASFLSAGDTDLAGLMLLGASLAIPALFVNLLRGAATGRQMWSAVAGERITNSMLRLIALGTLAILGDLTVLNAVLVSSLAPIVAGAAYWRLAFRPPFAIEGADPDPPLARSLLSFGSRIWLGAVASMLMARLSQLLVTPLSDTVQLGLLVVAITISDVPFIFAQTIRDVVFGVDSAEADPRRLADTARMATLIALLGSIVLGSTLPLWITALFGSGFQDAIVPTWLLLASAVITIPGLIAGAGLAAGGRPGLRSVALVVALATNLVAMLLLVPLLGAVGAALAALIANVLSTTVGVAAVARLYSVPALPFFVPRPHDFVFLTVESVGLIRRLLRRRRDDDT